MASNPSSSSSNQSQNAQSAGYTGKVKEVYNKEYERWVPWLEDQYLYYFGKDNKTSYAARRELDKTKITGVAQVDKLQDGVNDLVAGQVGKGGLLQPVGDLAGKEGALRRHLCASRYSADNQRLGINRVERGGKDEQGSYGGPLGGVTDPAISNAKNAGSAVTDGAKGAGNTVTEGAKGAGGYLTGLWGGGKKQ